jgi:P27 family predicted phage terminase small subunit
MRGARPKPAAQHEREGTARARKPAPRSGVGGLTLKDFPAPRDLSAAERRVWRETARELVEAGTLAKIDKRLLKAFVVAIAFIDEATAQIRADGLMVTGSRGQRRQHPLITARDRAITTARGLAETLGIGPAARARYDVRPQRGPADLQDMLDRELNGGSPA